MGAGQPPQGAGAEEQAKVPQDYVPETAGHDQGEDDRPLIMNLLIFTVPRI